MRPADRRQFVEVVVGMAALYDRELTEQAIELYWAAMQRWPIDDFRATGELLIRRCTFMPRPSDFEALRATVKPGGEAAWAKVLKHIEGAYRSGGLDGGGPIDQTVATLGGYARLAFLDVQYLGIKERDFIERYSEIVDAATILTAVPALARVSRLALGHDDEWPA